MHTEVVLDCQGDLPAPKGYRIISSEVDFLKWATEDIKLLIRGQFLCAWAEAFYTLRGRPYSYKESVSAVIQRTFSALTKEQASELSQKIELEAISPIKISASFVLNYCYPEDSSLWQGNASLKHAALWLLWLYSHQPSKAEKIILEHFCKELERRAGDTPERHLYQATDFKQAQLFLYSWMGLSRDEKFMDLGEFPVDVPLPLLNEIKSKWMHRLIESKGNYFIEMLSFPLPIVLRQELGQLTVHYYEENSKHLTREIIWHLQPYVPSQILSALEKQIPPPEPTSLPPEEIHVLKWFQTEYLPYRQWQSRNNDEHAAELVCSHARTFTYWYLRAYPRWLLESTWISFQQAALLKESSPHAIIFCAVVDGLPAWDAEDLAQAISGKIERLQLQQKSYCFAPLPTVTQFAKESLLKGVPPRLTSETPFLGKILPDNISPLQKLKNAKPGELYFWRLNQPDAAYHLESESKRNRQVRAELEVILQAIKDVVEGLPQHIPFTVIVTTDHGRLLNPKSPRRLPTPNGMQAHGRVAWGSIDQSFDEYGFKVDEEAGWIAIHGERFEMTHDMLIALNEDSFQNKKSGSEPFPHGGLFPEEAIVPWFVFERDATPPILEVDVNGAGEAAISGSITVTIKNASRLAITCLSTSLSHGGQASGHWDIAPLGTTEFKTQITPWPSKGDLAGIKASLLFRQPNGKTFTIEVSPRLNVISLYEQDDSILKELDL